MTDSYLTFRETWASREIVGAIAGILRASPGMSVQNVFNAARKQVRPPEILTELDPRFETAVWIAHPDRMNDMNTRVMHVIFAASTRDMVPRIKSLPQEKVQAVMEAIYRKPEVHFARGKKLTAVDIDQLALIYHVMRLGGHRKAAADICTHEMPPSAINHAWSLMRNQYVPTNCSGWNWGEASPATPPRAPQPETQAEIAARLRRAQYKRRHVMPYNKAA